MEYLSTTYGLVTDNDPTSENGQLFLAQLILLRDAAKVEPSVLTSFLKFQLQNSKVEKGLYNRNSELLDRTTSHDNLSGIFSWSFLTKTEHRFEIWNYLLKHLGTYDNTKGKSKQLSRFLPFNPSNFFIWGLCAESYIYLLFLPFYLISLIIACNKPKEDTSGKILAWVEMYPHREHWLVKHLFNYYIKKMTKMYSVWYVTDLMKIYHGGNSPDFPINKLLGL